MAQAAHARRPRSVRRLAVDPERRMVANSVQVFALEGGSIVFGRACCELSRLFVRSQVRLQDDCCWFYLAMELVILLWTKLVRSVLVANFVVAAG